MWTFADELADQASGAPLEALGRSDADEGRYAGGPAVELVGRSGAAFGGRAAGRSGSGGSYATGPRPVDGGGRVGGDSVASA